MADSRLAAALPSKCDALLSIKSVPYSAVRTVSASQHPVLASIAGLACTLTATEGKDALLQARQTYEYLIQMQRDTKP